MSRLVSKTGYAANISTLLCEKCGEKMYVPRIRKRENNHIKDIWCPRCMSTQKFRELIDGDFDPVAFEAQFA